MPPNVASTADAPRIRRPDNAPTTPWPKARLNLQANGVAVGDRGILIYGPAGCGKSSLSLSLIEAGRIGGRPTQLIGDDRLLLSSQDGRLFAAPAPGLEGLIFTRRRGLQRRPHRPLAPIVLSLDLNPKAAMSPPSLSLGTFRLPRRRGRPSMTPTEIRNLLDAVTSPSRRRRRSSLRRPSLRRPSLRWNDKS